MWTGGHRRVGRVNGLTLIELLVALAVLAILATMAAPSFSGMLGRYRADSAAQELKAALDVARSEAIKRAAIAQACPSSNGTSCSNSTNWATGWLVMADADGDGSLSASEVTLVGGAINGSLTFTSSATGAITFQSLGQVNGTVPNFTVTHTASAISRYVCLSSSGSSTIKTTSC